MPEELAMVKVGDSECGVLKLTPWSLTAAIAGAVSGLTIPARNPSGTNRMRLWGVLFCADTVAAESRVRPADRITRGGRKEVPPEERISGGWPVPQFSFAA